MAGFFSGLLNGAKEVFTSSLSGSAISGSVSGMASGGWVGAIIGGVSGTVQDLAKKATKREQEEIIAATNSGYEVGVQVPGQHTSGGDLDGDGIPYAYPREPGKRYCTIFYFDGNGGKHYVKVEADASGNPIRDTLVSGFLKSNQQYVAQWKAEGKWNPVTQEYCPNGYYSAGGGSGRSTDQAPAVIGATSSQMWTLYQSNTIGLARTM